jgi:hypothetical protein
MSQCYGIKQCTQEDVAVLWNQAVHTGRCRSVAESSSAHRKMSQCCGIKQCTQEDVAVLRNQALHTGREVTAEWPDRVHNN